MSNATGYRVDRGTALDLPKLLDASLDSCVRFEGAGTSTGSLTEVPADGSFYWYLVIGVRGSVAGDPGEATAGPRVVNAAGTGP